MDFLVEGDILPEIAEILRGEVAAIGPFVALAQLEGEDAFVLNVVAFQNIRMKLEFFVITDEAGIAADRHQPDITLAANEHAHRAAMFSWLTAKRFHVDDARVFRQPFGYVGQFALFPFFLEIGGVGIGGSRIGRQENGGQQGKGGAARDQGRSSRISALPFARTKWPSPRSAEIMSPSPSSRNCLPQSNLPVALILPMVRKSSGRSRSGKGTAASSDLV
ncbi:hypothetical protein D3C86_1357410 [compost metagenome]